MHFCPPVSSRLGGKSFLVVPESMPAIKHGWRGGSMSSVLLKCLTLRTHMERTFHLQAACDTLVTFPQKAACDTMPRRHIQLKGDTALGQTRAQAVLTSEGLNSLIQYLCLLVHSFICPKRFPILSTVIQKFKHICWPSSPRYHSVLFHELLVLISM